MTTLNSKEEFLLAKKLLDLHPWAGGAKFARTGGEANAIAIRIARANRKNKNIAVCGYHGWHDWYLATNLQSDNNLDEHLLSGLSTKGVPRSLKDTVIPFSFNKSSAIIITYIITNF